MGELRYIDSGDAKAVSAIFYRAMMMSACIQLGVPFGRASVPYQAMNFVSEHK
jgi:hypothetical protein